MIPDEVFAAKVAEVDALREYAKQLEDNLDKVIQWVISIHGQKSMDNISPDLKNWTRMITAKSNSGQCHRL